MTKLEDILDLRLGYRGSHLTSYIQKAVRAIIADIESDFIVIDRAELPETTVKDGCVHVAGADSTWPIRTLNLDLNRKWALQYLAAGEAVAKARAEGDTKLTKRRNELARKFHETNCAFYDLMTDSTRKAIDYIIESEDKK